MVLREVDHLFYLDHDYRPSIRRRGQLLSISNIWSYSQATGFLKMWGESLRGLTVVCHTDNTVAQSMLEKLWGQATFIPLLREIDLLMVKYDIALSPQRISTGDNTLSDCLSRGAMDEFHRELETWSKVSLRDKDMEDWQLDPDEVATLD